MNTNITGRHLDLTEGMKNSALSAIESLKKYNLDIISTSVIITSLHAGKLFNVEFTINIAHKETVVIHQEHKDVYAAIDEVASRAQKSLRRYHDKLIDHKAEKLEIIDEDHVNSSTAN